VLRFLEKEDWGEGGTLVGGIKDEGCPEPTGTLKGINGPKRNKGVGVP